MFEWHFTIRGPPDSEFAGGIYHGKILLPPEYPFKPPNIVFLTPSGRFETNVKVCLSFSAHHPELWQPAWGIRLILEAIISFLPTPADGAIGALDWSKEERAKLAKESVNFHCPLCCAAGQSCADLLPELKPAASKKGDDGVKKSKFQQEIEKLKMLQGMHHAKEEEEDGGGDATADNSESKEDEKTEQLKTDESTKLTPNGIEDDAKVKSITAPKRQETEPYSEESNDDCNPPPLPENEIPHQNSSEANNDVITSLQQSSSDDAVETPATKNVTDTTGDTTARNQQNNIPAPPAQTIGDQRNDLAVIPQNNILVSDPFLNGMILAFAVTVMYLLREAHSLLDELYELRS